MTYRYKVGAGWLGAGELEQLRQLCAQYEVKELSLFGSALGENFTAASDLDFLVEFQPNARIGLLRFVHLRDALSTLFQRKVDLISKKGLKPRIRDRILSQAQLIYAG